MGNLTKNTKKLNNNINLNIVIGNYYWVKSFSDYEYQPTIAVDYYKNGQIYFKFLNGAIIECKRVEDYKELNYR